MELPYLDKNKRAITRFVEEYGEPGQAFEKNPGECGGYLRNILMFCCAACGQKHITLPILKFYKFGADALCYDCQNKAKKSRNNGN